MSFLHQPSNHLSRLALAAASVALCACAAATEPDDPGARVSSDNQALHLQFDPERLRHGKAKPLVTGITSIENQLFTRDGRLFITGDEGIWEVVAGANGAYRAQAVHSGETCAFGGLAEYAGTLYANCYDLTRSSSEVFASPLGDKLDFRVIHELPGVALANGLAADGTGNLYIASTYDGRIIRLHLQDGDPLTVATQTDFNAQSGLFTNGLKYFASALYWTAFTTLYTAPIRSDGTSGPTRALHSALTFFDDLHIDGNGIWQADYLNGAIVALDLDGELQSSTPNGTFTAPSSVQPALGRLHLPPDAFVVTDKGANQLSVYLQ